MKPSVKHALLAFLVVGISGTVLQAAVLEGVTIGGVPVPYGKILIKYQNYDVGSQYITENGTYSGENTLNSLAQSLPPKALPGEDGWAILRVDSISNLDGTITYYNRYTADVEITGILWGERDTYLSQTGTGSALTQDIHGVGMHAAFYEDASMNFDPVPGPNARAADGSYPTVTDGNLLFTFDSTPGWDVTYPTDEFFTTFRPNATAGDTSANGGMYAVPATVPAFGGGTMTGAMNDSVGPIGRADFTGMVGTNGWLVNSNDPFVLTIVPEPATLAMLALGALAVIRRRRS